MNFEGIKDYGFYVNMGGFTIIASILTLIFTQLIKIILKKKKIIYEGMDESIRM